ncbi:MAG: helix-turn-helix transcriptional regulator [Bacilli bacterium]|nr:helix-turn-helix transcriptional regulator [Bacilli bacterium]
MTASLKIRHLIGEACNKQDLKNLGALADHIGCSIASIYRWYNGESTPKARFIYALATAAGISDVATYLQ